MDLTNYIEDLLDRIEEKLEFSNWHRENKLTWKHSDGISSFSLLPILLTYKENGKEVSKIWFFLRVVGDTGYTQDALNDLGVHLKLFQGSFLHPDYDPANHNIEYIKGI